MKYTNNLNLPEPIVSAITNKKYSNDGSDYSVTGLLQPPQLSRLKRQHSGELTEDIADNIFALFGNSIHEILDKSSNSGLSEKRFKAEYSGNIVSGQIDRYFEGTIQDWKIASVWECIYGIKPDKIAQLNIYADLMRENGCEVNKLQLVYIFRDWSKREAKYNPDYPKHQVWVADVELWPTEKVKQFIADRIELHQGDSECSDDDRWAKPEKWAVIKPGNKKAAKLHSTERAAIEHAESTNHGYVVEHRPGENVRCDSYCPVSEVCEQYKKLKEVMNANKVN